MLTIYHNPRCRKSREGLKYLETKNLPFAVRNYFEEPLTENELKNLIGQMGIAPETLVRKQEALFKELFKGKTLADEAWIAALVQHPKLLQRPIITNGEKAVLAQPPEKLDELLN